MAWFSGKVSLGNFPDLAGAVNKFSESVKNIEKNFDSALGLDDKAASGGGGATSTSEASGAWPADLMAFMGQKGENVTVDSTEKLESSSPQVSSLSKEKEGDQADKSADSVDEHYQSVTEEHVETVKPEEHEDHPAETNAEILEEANSATQKLEETNVIKDEQAGAVNKFSESVKKNFDSALGLDDKAACGGGGTTSTSEASGAWPADLMAFMGQKGENVTVDCRKTRIFKPSSFISF